ncbi:MAG: fused MFS/spermidine synthase [Chloroflexi bacterium]|nr:fused MFS/spermidine synthase [Chloroflexota bacterium]
MKLGLWTSYVIVFVSSACTLILELVAGRILAPIIGVSLYSWTSIIGVVLAGISLGNYLGGRVADRWPSPRTLGLILFGGGLASLLVLPLAVVAQDQGVFRTVIVDAAPQARLMLRILLLTTMCFFLPAFILGMVSPVVVKLVLRDLSRSGNTVGKIYAFSTLGSIVGTFFTGFYLIATFGTRMIVLGVGVVLIVMAVIFGGMLRPGRPGHVVASAGGLVLLALLLATSSAVNAFESPCQKETDYYCIKVYDQDHGNNRVLRTLVLDHLIHSYTDMNDPTYLEYSYLKVYAELTDYVARDRPDFRSVFIGGGGYTLPKALPILYPRSSVDVVEIDPGVTEIAEQFLGLSPDSRVNTINFDARLVFEDLVNGPKYDLVFGDAFNDLSVPYHLTTREFDALVRAVLSDNGLYMVNVIDKMQGGLFIPAYVRSMQAAFPHVYIMASGSPWNTSLAYTYTVVGSLRPIDEARLRTVKGQNSDGSIVTRIMPADEMRRWLDAQPGPMLTDDYAPADNLLAPLFAERGQ